MPNPPRRSFLALVPLLLASCAAPAGPTATSASPAPSNAAATTLAPASPTQAGPSQGSSAEPTTPACPARPVGMRPNPILGDEDDMFWLPLVVTRVAPTATPDVELPTPEPGPANGAPQFFLGGQRVRMDLAHYDAQWQDSPLIVDRAALTLQAPGEDPIEIQTEIVAGSRLLDVAVPDLTWSGPLLIDLAWHDPCFTYEAKMTTWLWIDTPASVADCSTSPEPAFDELDATFAPKIHVGSLVVALIAWRFTGKVTSLSISGDSYPPYVGFRRDTPVIAAASGSTLRIEDNTSVRTLSIHEEPAAWSLLDPPPSEVIFFERGPLIRWIEGGLIHGEEPEAPVVFRSPLVAVDGGFTFAVPSEPGRYAAQPMLNYNSSCSFGLGGFVVGVDVQ